MALRYYVESICVEESVSLFEIYRIMLLQEAQMCLLTLSYTYDFLADARTPQYVSLSRILPFLSLISFDFLFAFDFMSCSVKLYTKALCVVSALPAAKVCRAGHDIT